jgi:hypothetical protein
MILAEFEPEVPSFCLRVDLDYVPWDTPDADEFGHGEPAIFLKLLEFARLRGFAFHFFASNRVLSAFPSIPEAVLNEGHALDWLCKHPSEEERWDRAAKLFKRIGHEPTGIGCLLPWPKDIEYDAEFYSGPRCELSRGTAFFCQPDSLRDSIREKSGYAEWMKSFRNRSEKLLTLVVRPQVLAKTDPQISGLIGLVDKLCSEGRECSTLKSLLKKRN